MERTNAVGPERIKSVSGSKSAAEGVTEPIAFQVEPPSDEILPSLTPWWTCPRRR